MPCPARVPYTELGKASGANGGLRLPDGVVAAPPLQGVRITAGSPAARLSRRHHLHLQSRIPRTLVWKMI